MRLGATATVLAIVASLATACGALPATSSSNPAALNGQALYHETCAYCHGANGQGNVRLSAPKLWGKGNLIQGSAYDTPQALTQFVKRYMPLQPVNGLNPGSLTTSQAQSLAQYILAQNRAH